MLPECLTLPPRALTLHDDSVLLNRDVISLLAGCIGGIVSKIDDWFVYFFISLDLSLLPSRVLSPTVPVPLRALMSHDESVLLNRDVIATLAGCITGIVSKLDDWFVLFNCFNG